MLNVEDSFLFVNEIFKSIQGEGYWTGTPAVFIRLSGCNLKCKWCDTQHEIPRYKLKLSTVLKNVDMRLKGTNIRHVIITGGEPFLQKETGLLAHELRKKGLQVHFETNGTLRPFPLHTGWWITISPKPGHPVDKLVARYASEYKYIIAKDTEVVLETGLPAGTDPPAYGGVRVYMQPCDDSERWKNAAICQSICIKHGYSMSFQAHKFFDIK